MSPADWTLEAKESISRGYTCFKMKARPWWDIVEQVETVSEVVPDDYKFDVDFNGFLLNSSRAEVMLQRLDEVPNVGMYESPFYLGTDLTGPASSESGCSNRSSSISAKMFSTPTAVTASSSAGASPGAGRRTPWRRASTSRSGCSWSEPD